MFLGHLHGKCSRLSIAAIKAIIRTSKARTHSLDEAGPDLWALGVQGNTNRSVLDTARLEALACLTHILDGLCMVLQKGREV